MRKARSLCRHPTELADTFRSIAARFCSIYEWTGKGGRADRRRDVQYHTQLLHLIVGTNYREATHFTSQSLGKSHRSSGTIWRQPKLLKICFGIMWHTSEIQVAISRYSPINGVGPLSLTRLKATLPMWIHSRRCRICSLEAYPTVTSALQPSSYQWQHEHVPVPE